jgi:SAM-dependent methyltransferase
VTTPECRACGEPGVRPFLSLGTTPLADALVHERELAAPEPRFPLDVGFCTHCTLVQILDTVPPEQLFVDNYHYFSSFSDALLSHARDHATRLIAERGLGPHDLVVEVASNDGYLLRNFVAEGIPVLGIDPSPGPAHAAIDAGIPTLLEFFGTDLARWLREAGLQAKVLIANNVMAHVPDLNGFVEGIRIVLADDGIATIENPCVTALVEHCEFDTIYHEHHCYFSCTAVAELMRRHELVLNDVEYFPDLHGGTMRWTVSHGGEPSVAVLDTLARERASGATEFPYYASFGARVEALRDELRAVLGEAKARGATIAAYGAAAKGATLCNYVGIGRDLVDFVVDRNVHKHGRYMPGTHQPILGPEALLAAQPDYVLLLAWNFRAEVMAQQAEYVRRGGRFIVPVPWPEISPPEPAALTPTGPKETVG